MPTGDLRLTWESPGQRMGKKQQLLNQEVFHRYTHTPMEWLPFLGSSDTAIPLAPSLDFFRRLARTFIHALKQLPDPETLRHQAQIAYDPEELSRLCAAAPLMVGAEYLNTELLIGIWEEMQQGFSQGLREFKGTVSAYVHRFSPHIHLAGRVYFHLVESKNGEYPFEFLATYTPDPSRPEKHRPLQWALKAFSDAPEQLVELLGTVHAAAHASPLLKELLDSGDLFHHLAWDAEEAHAFLLQIEAFEHAGIICRIPDWWKRKSAFPTLQVRLGTAQPAMVGIDAILNVNLELILGDMPITLEEIKALLNQHQGLARLKNQWVQVDRERLESLLTAYEKALEITGNGMTINQALQLVLHPEQLDNAPTTGETIVEISNGEWMETVFARLKDPALVPRTKLDNAFQATLRPYQQQGLNWLAFLDGLGFGACLADDMGLGKTVQVLAFLWHLKKKEPGSTSLLVVPASLLSNWDAEIKRFCPGLTRIMAHPGYGTAKSKTTLPPVWTNHDLVITTYAMVQRHDSLLQTQWRTLILDEAQAIKNPATRQTRAVKQLKAATRITMTGTPIENALSDLWSLFDFINPGLLGNATEFKAFSKKLKKDPSGYQRLKKVVAPYILRRMKTDRRIVPDLPDKVEMTTYPELSRKQQVLYLDFIREIEARLASTDTDIKRKGLVLSAIVKLKQICNHPDQYLGGGDFSAKESGKFVRLKEICDTIHAKRERVLVFTQFQEMTTPLANLLETVFEQPGGILHGGIPVGKRKALIDRFQAKAYTPFMVLSLKAGGTGLNLTRATHVIHFDRWWNPAVEDQATDRAFRIGQTRKVIVHKFVTRGTIEERIHEMIQQKKELADEIISDSQGSWITQLDNKELMALFTLKI